MANKMTILRGKKKQTKSADVHDVWKRISTFFFQPPYYGVPWLVWLYALASMFIYLHAGGPLTGHLIGFDDHVRMVQVLNLVNGADWYDRTITRVNAPDGFHTIWPRIVDLPIAAVILIAQQFVSQKTAALIASVVVPYAELALLFSVATYFARPLVGKNHARLMAMFLLFTSVLNQKKYTISGFHPGQASHHAWYIILDLLMFAAAARVVLNVRLGLPHIIMAGAIGVLLAVGIESIPLVGGLAGIFALLAWLYGDASLAARGAQGFTYAAVACVLLLPLNNSPAHWFDISFAEPSFLACILVGMAAGFLALEQKLLKFLPDKKWLNGICLVSLAGLFGCGLLLAFPQIRDGAAAGLSPLERAMASRQHPEAWPMYILDNSILGFLELYVPLVFALVAAFVEFRRAASQRRQLLVLCYAGFNILCITMAQMFWRYVHHAYTTASVWWLRLWQVIHQQLKMRLVGKKVIYVGVLSLFVFIFLAPFWLLLVPAIRYNVPFLTQVAFFPSKVLGAWEPCEVKGIAPYLNSHYGERINLVVPEDESARFLYHTHLHIDFLANFPSQDKFVANQAFFQSNVLNVSATIARQHNIDLVILCPYLPMIQQLAQSRPNRAPMLMERLVEGQLPQWLKAIPTNWPGHYLLFEVIKSKLSANSPVL